MQHKSITRLFSALFCLVLIASAVFSLGHARRKDPGQMPIQVICSPTTVASGSKFWITVYLSGTTTLPQVVNMSYTGPNFKKMILDGPSNCTIPAGSNNGYVSATLTGNSGDQYTIQASCNGGSAYGTVTIQ